MTKTRRTHVIKVARAKRDKALERNEFRAPSVPREFPSGVTSAPIKVEDMEVRKLIDEALARRAG